MILANALATTRRTSILVRTSINRCLLATWYHTLYIYWNERYHQNNLLRLNNHWLNYHLLWSNHLSLLLIIHNLSLGLHHHRLSIVLLLLKLLLLRLLRLLHSVLLLILLLIAVHFFIFNYYYN